MQFRLYDRVNALIGTATVRTAPGARLTGTFVPTDAFAAYAPLFLALEQAANEQRLPDADRLQAGLARHGFWISGPLPLTTRADIEDLQIMAAGISFRLLGASPDDQAFLARALLDQPRLVDELRLQSAEPPEPSQ